MPNELGLLSKQEAKAVRDINLLNGATDIKWMAHLIKEVQQMGDTQTHVEFNKVVHEDVYKYFKNTVGYDVTQHPVGQPVGFTKILSVSWLI